GKKEKLPEKKAKKKDDGE
nr:Ovofactor-1 {N-terminal} [chickens, egg white, Peptide Partial, 18 aa] [Gallus gallus]